MLKETFNRANTGVTGGWMFRQKCPWPNLNVKRLNVPFFSYKNTMADGRHPPLWKSENVPREEHRVCCCSKVSFLWFYAVYIKYQLGSFICGLFFCRSVAVSPDNGAEPVFTCRARSETIMANTTRRFTCYFGVFHLGFASFSVMLPACCRCSLLWVITEEKQ
jgi:hypothetical protein